MTKSNSPLLMLPSRRRVLQLGTAAIAAPYVWAGVARAAAGQVIVRSPGGAAEANNREMIWTPFQKETGIEVVPVPATVSKLFAMFKSGNVELDVIDVGAGPLLNLQRQNALAPIAYESWKQTNPADIKDEYKSKFHVGYSLFATVMGINAQAVEASKRPKNWVEFWDAGKFPGPRSLMDLATGNPNLEFAMMADGVPKDKIYPIDLDKAFASLTRIRSSIPKFWDTGALSVQMLIDREVIMNSIWSSRINPAIAAGNPLAVEWEGHVTQVQSYAVFKNAKNLDNAQRLIEFAVRADTQARSLPQSSGGPTNIKANALLPAGYSDNVPGSSKLLEKGIMMNDVWWEDNRDAVNRRWARWIQS